MLHIYITNFFCNSIAFKKIEESLWKEIAPFLVFIQTLKTNIDIRHRYWAIHDPIHYATQRTAGKVYFMIFLVWLFSCIICSPPLLGNKESNLLMIVLTFYHDGRMEWLARSVYSWNSMCSNHSKSLYCVFLIR